MISYRRNTWLAPTVLTLIVAFGTGAQAQTFVQTDPSNWGIAGYEVKELGDGASAVDVVSSPANKATITIKPSGAGMTAEIVMSQSKETLLMDASDPKKGVLYLDGKLVASWTESEEKCEQKGFDKLAKSPAYVVLAKSLQDSQLAVAQTSNKVIVPILRCAVGLVQWCTNQCNACALHYATNPPIGTPEPASCGHCFSWYCGG